MKEGISVYSSYAQDILMKEDGEVLSRQSGGPALFLQESLLQAQVPFELFHGETIDVEIMITDSGEFGKISRQSEALLFPSQTSSDWAVVSTLLKEWDLKSLNDFNGKLFVDIQGYVRNGNDFGKKQVWNEVREIAPNIFCLKGTKEEVNYVPQDVLEYQKNRLLIVTDGSNGLEIFYKGGGFSVPAEKISKPKDTIGAGDTFFGFFVSSMYKGYDPEEAAREASKKTANFLQSKS